MYDRTKHWIFSDLLPINTQPGLTPVENVVIVTHGLTMRFFLMTLQQWSPTTFETVWNSDNCSMWVLKRDLTVAGPLPYVLCAEEGDKVRSSRTVGVHFTDGTSTSLLLREYLEIPPPRSRQFTVHCEMLSAQHGLDPGTIAAVDVYDGHYGDPRDTFPRED